MDLGRPFRSENDCVAPVQMSMASIPDPTMNVVASGAIGIADRFAFCTVGCPCGSGGWL